MVLAKNSPYIKEYTFKSGGSFLKAISYNGELYHLLDGNYIFRGHQSDEYKLIPTALRKNLMEKESFTSSEKEGQMIFLLGEMEIGQVMKESQILFDFFYGCDNVGLRVPSVRRYAGKQILIGDFESLFGKENWLPDDLLDIAALAQHYGLPTRLLDWSADLYTAMYFAVTGAMREQVSPVVMTEAEWRETVKGRLNQQMKLLQREEQLKPSAEKRMEIWALDKRLVLMHYNEMSLRVVRPTYEGNPNLCAQKGFFTYWEVLKPLKHTSEGVSYDFEQFVDKQSLDVKLTDRLLALQEESRPYLYHFTIPVSSAKELYKFLSRQKTDASSLFPGYYGVVRKMEEDKIARS